MSPATQFTAPDEAQRYLLSGAPFRVTSRATGHSYVYRVRAKHGGQYASVLCDEDGRWRYVGVVKWSVVTSTDNCELRLDDPRRVAIGWLLAHLRNHREIPDSCEVWAEPV